MSELNLEQQKEFEEELKVVADIVQDLRKKYNVTGGIYVTSYEDPELKHEVVYTLNSKHISLWGNGNRYEF